MLDVVDDVLLLVLLLDVLDTVVVLLVEVVVAPAGAVTVRANAPLEPPHEPAYPSSTMT